MSLLDEDDDDGTAEALLITKGPGPVEGFESKDSSEEIEEPAPEEMWE